MASPSKTEDRRSDGETQDVDIRQAAGELARKSREAGQRFTQTATGATREAGQILQSSADASLRLFQQASEQVSRAYLGGEEAQEVLQRAARDFNTALECSSILVGGSQSVWREWVECSRQITERNLKTFAEMNRPLTLPGLAAAQAEIMKTDIALMLEAGQRIAAITTSVTDQARRTYQDMERPAS